ncbi:MAG: YggT family protein [Candidatus Eisenbacteria bacterium]|nr:YggT family protein [Candidatus Eisenbacteria bacterium]
MFAVGPLLGAVTMILDVALTAYYWLLIVYALMSWVSPDPYNPIVRFISSLAEPFLDAIRKLLPFARMGVVDLSAFVGILLVMGTRHFVVGALQNLRFQLGAP